MIRLSIFSYLLTILVSSFGKCLFVSCAHIYVFVYSAYESFGCKYLFSFGGFPCRFITMFGLTEFFIFYCGWIFFSTFLYNLLLCSKKSLLGEGELDKGSQKEGKKKGNWGLNWSLKNRPGLNVFFSALSTQWQRALGVVWKRSSQRRL